MKRTVSMILMVVVLVVCAFSASASADQLSYWEATQENFNRIGRFKSNNITYSYQKLNNNNSFYFNEGVVHGKNQWTGALGINLTYSLLMQNADIKIYGGTVNDLYSMGHDISAFNSPAIRAVAEPYLIYTYPVYQYGEKVITNYTIRSASILMLDSGNTRAGDLTVLTHEMGHTLGWLDHSADSSLLMSAGGRADKEPTLTTRDINHLKQVYDK